MDAQPQLRLRPGAAEWRADDGEAVILDLTRSWYMGLNQAATLLWGELARGTTREHLVALLRDSYALETDQAARDVDAFLAECAQRGLID